MIHSDKKRITIFLKKDLIIQAKAQALVEDISLTALIEIALVNYLPTETLIKRKAFLLGLF